MSRLLLLWCLWAAACGTDDEGWDDDIEGWDDDDNAVDQGAVEGEETVHKGVSAEYGNTDKDAEVTDLAPAASAKSAASSEAAGKKSGGARASKKSGRSTPSEVPEYDSSWKELISGDECPAETQLIPTNDGAIGGVITCESTDSGGRKFKFPPGKFDIDEQVVVPAGTEIEGNSNPVDPDDKEKEPELATQTYFIATTGVDDGEAAYCGTDNNMSPGDAELLRIGFLLYSNTVVRYISYQGRDKVRPNDNGNLCGGGVFETPGCVSPGFGDGTGEDWVDKRQGCFDHAGGSNSLILGDGKGVENVVVDSVRLNGLFLPEDGDYVHGQGSQVAVWVAITKDGSVTKNVRITNLVSMFSRGDGINLHGNVQDSVVEDCYIANTGDDAYAAWGAYAEYPAGNTFRNNVAKNVGAVRDYGYGVCMAIYGAQDVTVTGMKCIDLGRNDWNSGQDPDGNDRCLWGPNCNSALAIIHDGWFGAVYPEGNTINIYDNEYVDFDGNPITEDDRPQVRLQGQTSANWVSSAPVIQEVSVISPRISAAANSSTGNIMGLAIGAVLAGLAASCWAARRGRALIFAGRDMAPLEGDSGSSAEAGLVPIE